MLHCRLYCAMVSTIQVCCSEVYLKPYGISMMELFYENSEGLEAEISPENTCVGVSFKEPCRSSVLQLYYKETPTQMVFCKIWENFRSISFTDHLQLLLFKIKSSSNLFKNFSAISLTCGQQICDHFQLSQWQTNLKMHSLTKNMFPYSTFVKDLEQISYLLKYHLNIINFPVLLHLCII